MRFLHAFRTPWLLFLLTVLVVLSAGTYWRFVRPPDQPASVRRPPVMQRPAPPVRPQPLLPTGTLREPAGCVPLAGSGDTCLRRSSF